MKGVGAFYICFEEFCSFAQVAVSLYIGLGTHMEPLSMFEEFYVLLCLKLVRLIFDASYVESL